jgi:RNA polymerase sigma-70 factor, ECF subfamily
MRGHEESKYDDEKQPSEIDGDAHFAEKGRERDRVRDQRLMSLGYKILRIPGCAVTSEGELECKPFESLCKAKSQRRAPHPLPLSPNPDSLRLARIQGEGSQTHFAQTRNCVRHSGSLLTCGGAVQPESDKRAIHSWCLCLLPDAGRRPRFVRYKGECLRSNCARGQDSVIGAMRLFSESMNKPAAFRGLYLDEYAKVTQDPNCMSELASRLADDESLAWAELYDMTIDALFAYVTDVVGNRETAADVVQEAFLRLHRSRDGLRGVEDLNAFVFTVVRNEANRALARNRKHASKGEVTEPPIDEFSHSHDDDLELIHHALTMLSVDERELIQMKIFGQMTFSQIAAVLDLPIGTCTSRYRRSLEKMRVFLQEQIG